LEILDPLKNTVSGTVAVGRLPHGIAANADERTVYVTDEGSGDVSVIDLVDRKVTATITIDTIGGTPREIVVQRRSIRALVSLHDPSDAPVSSGAPAPNVDARRI
jgi:YVTN family beta-propeller protein